MKNLLERLSTIESTLPTKQKKLCEYITANGKSVYLMSVAFRRRQAWDARQ